MKKQSNVIVFIFLTAIVFFFFRELFNSYFEADEWFHFTRYLPLTRESGGALLALIRSVTDSIALSEGQHVVPIGEEIFFLNTKFFGINFVPYAFMSLLLHSINSFLVFILISIFLQKSNLKNKRLVSITGAAFFALSAIPMHAVTWAAFYGQNVLSVTFFLLTIIFFKIALNTKNKKYLIFSSFFLLLDLLTKETSVVLFLVLPFLAFQDRGTFSVRTFVKIFALPLIIFIPFRFILPVLYSWLAASLKMTSTNVLYEPTKFDLSVILFRIFTFPISMISQVFISNSTLVDFMRTITPYIYYKYPGEPAIRGTYREFFINGPGINFLYYIISIGLAVLVFAIIKSYLSSKKAAEAKAVAFGFVVIILSALPLVLNVLNRPWWGTEYFDSRHYYMPTVGAAVLFPFLLLFLGNAISTFVKTFTRIPLPAIFISAILFSVWFLSNSKVFVSNIDIIVTQTGDPRKQIIKQIKSHLPKLPDNVIFYAETDGGGAYGTILPFQTSIPQVLTVAYFDKNPLPDSFFDSFIFGGSSEGYKFSDGRGFGYYSSKKSLSNALLSELFKVDDIYAFYYESSSGRIKNITDEIRLEMNKYLENASELKSWSTFKDSPAGIAFKIPAGAQVTSNKIKKDSPLTADLLIKGAAVNTGLEIIPISSGLVTSDIANLFFDDSVILKKVYFDDYNFNEVYFINREGKVIFIIKGDGKILRMDNINKESEEIAERILGSVEFLSAP